MLLKLTEIVKELHIPMLMQNQNRWQVMIKLMFGQELKELWQLQILEYMSTQSI